MGQDRSGSEVNPKAGGPAREWPGQGEGTQIPSALVLPLTPAPPVIDGPSQSHVLLSRQHQRPADPTSGPAAVASLTKG